MVNFFFDHPIQRQRETETERLRGGFPDRQKDRHTAREQKSKKPEQILEDDAHVKKKEKKVCFDWPHSGFVYLSNNENTVLMRTKTE